MSLRKLPEPRAFQRPKNYTWDAPFDALEKWAALPFAAEADDPNTVSILDVIGDDMFGAGFTDKRMAAALRKIGKNDVTVNINSPGGDMFMGMSIYNLLREHPAKVTVKVMGLAASAASLIAMAGDEVLMGAGSLLMVHRAWGLVIGNMHDFDDAAEMFNTFDRSMADIYAGRTGKSVEEIVAMLDGPRKASDGTWLTPEDAVKMGFADGTFDGPEPEKASAAVPDHVLARRKIEADLARAGVPRPEREERLNVLLGARDAAQQPLLSPRDATQHLPAAARDAGDVTMAELARLISTIQS